jgi:hypothetical protein
MRTRRSILAASVSFAVLAGAVSAQERVRVPAALLDAHDTLRALYPDLKGRAIFVDTVSTAGHLRLRVSEAPASPSLTRDVLLNATIDLDSRGALGGLRTTGALVREASNRSLAARLRRALDPDAVLAAEALPFGPAAQVQLEAVLPIAALRRFGGSVTVVSVTGVRMPRAMILPLSTLPDPGEFQPPFCWRVVFRVSRPGVPDQIHTLDFEPYEGRPIRMTRRNVQ